MIIALIALAAAQAAAPAAATPETCAGLARTAPEKAVEAANGWRLRGGGLAARQCLGLAYANLQRWAPAAVAFEQAALEAETARDPGRADFWVQSGNAWLAAGEAAKARKAFDAALATTLLTDELRGEVHLDRARAAVALGDAASARTDIDLALKLVAADPFAWYLSSALALREQNVVRARADIAKGLELAPTDPDLLLQAGTAAGIAGDVEAARDFYARAAKAAPASPAGRAAQAALAVDAATQP
jgi:tetratricopeptide (TPR) repeat protein